MRDVGKRERRVLVAGIFLLGACSSSAHTAASPPPTARLQTSTATRRSTTTARPQPAATTPSTTTTATATTATRDFSFDESVPPPKLVNTGKDYVAIVRSLVEYGNWLGAHRPIPSLTATIVAKGTTLYDLYVQDLTRLSANHVRGIETLGGPSRFTILSVRPQAFSAKVVEDIRSQRTVVASGEVTSEVHFSEPTTYLRLVVLVGGRWYMAASDIQRPVNVHL